MAEGFDLPDPAEAVRNRILFTLLERAHGKHWKSPFEIEIALASRNFEPPIPKDLVAPFARDLARAVEFFHGAAVSIDLETMRSRPVKGEPTSYVFFDGYVLRIGSLGYQAW